MMKAILRTTLLASAAYGIYAVAKKYYPSQVDSALDSAKSFGNDALKSAKTFSNDAVKSLTDQGDKLSSSAQMHGKNIQNQAKDVSRRAV
jgi:TolA-binding protein